MIPESLYEEHIPTEIKECIGETFIVEGQEAVLVGYNSESRENDCIVGFRSSMGWTGFEDSDVILSVKNLKLIGIFRGMNYKKAVRSKGSRPLR